MKWSNRITVKMAVNLVATIFLLIAMGFRITGVALHELIGIGAFAALVLHQILNLHWYSSLPKGKYALLRTINTVTNVLMLMTMAVLLTTGILTSRFVFPFEFFHPGMLARQIHVMSAYWGLILVSIHIGLHWSSIMGFFHRHFGKPNKPIRTILSLAGILFAVYGIKASFDRDVWAKLIMYYSFDFFNPNESVAMFYLSYLAIMSSWISAAYYGTMCIRKFSYQQSSF